MDAAAREPGTKLPSLDGWRALSITLVLISHAVYSEGFPEPWKSASGWLNQGNLGVRMFLVISGFLITLLLLREHEATNRISLSRFYLRRSIRILPVYFAFLAVVAVLQVLTPFDLPVRTWLLHLTFTTNFIDLPYSATGHLWSIAVEEQFYLLWPVLLVSLGLARRPRLALLALVVPAAFSPIARVVTYEQWAHGAAAPFFLDFSLLNYVDVLAIGCASAVLYRAHESAVAERLGGRNALHYALLGAGLIALPLVLNGLSLAHILTVPFGFTLQAAGMAVLLIQSIVLADYGPYRLLNAGPIVQVGVLSYSLYIWHMLFCIPAETFGLPRNWAMLFPFWIVPACAAAALSFYCLERPLLKLRSRLRVA